MSWLKESEQARTHHFYAGKEAERAANEAITRRWEEAGRRVAAIDRRETELKQELINSGAAGLLLDVWRRVWESGGKLKYTYHVSDGGEIDPGINSAQDVAYCKISLEAKSGSEIARRLEDALGIYLGLGWPEYDEYLSCERLSLSIQDVEGERCFVLESLRGQQTGPGEPKYKLRSDSRVRARDKDALEQVKRFLNQDSQERIRGYRLPQQLKYEPRDSQP